MYGFKLPDLGEGTAEAELICWRVREGDIVEEDQPLAEVMTDKATLELPSPRAGRVHRLCGKDGDIIAVGQVLIEIDAGHHDPVAAGEGQTAEPRGGPLSEDDAANDGASERPSARPISEPHDAGSRGNQPPILPPRPHASTGVTAEENRPRADAVPPVRERAKELGIDIEEIPGTGPDGRVMRRDVEAYHDRLRSGESAPSLLPSSSASTADEPDWTRKPLRRLRRFIAERMTHSKATIPHYTYVDEVDMTTVMEERKRLAESSGRDKISILAFIARSVVRGLENYPQLNACMDETTREIIYKGKIHLGIAVATKEGLLVPVIRNAADLGVQELASSIVDLSDRAHKKKLSLDELRGSTITITSLGKLGGLMATPIINIPASAIVGVHALRTLPRYQDGQVKPRDVMNLSISLDHRIVDGFEGARFVQEAKKMLEEADFQEFSGGLSHDG